MAVIRGDGGSTPVLEDRNSVRGSTPTAKNTGKKTTTAAAGGGGGASDGGYAASLAAAKRSQKARDKAGRKNYKTQAEILKAQADSLRAALAGAGFMSALEQRLRNIDLNLGQQRVILEDDYEARADTLEGASEDNEKAFTDTSAANTANRARERQNAITQAMSQGAGESDLMRAEQMSLRSWDANQGDVNRSYFDTLRSINSSLTDLNVDTRTGLAGLHLQANQDRDAAWTNYYDQMSKTWTQLGNTLGQGSSNAGQAAQISNDPDSGIGKKGRKQDRRDRDQMAAQAEKAYNKAAGFTGKAFADPGLPPSIQDWEGRDPITGYTSTSVYLGGDQAPERKKPEGAKLRSWT